MKDGKQLKYMALMEQLKNDILTGKIKPGQKLPSENELSETFQISRHTVRKALTMLTNEGYVMAEHGKGTFCMDRTRKRKPSGNIAVITTYLSDYIFPSVIKGIDEVLTEDGYSIILKSTGNSRQQEARCLEEILKKAVDGVIIEPSKSQIFCRHEELYRRLEEYGVPYVFIQGIYPQMQEKPHILLDDYKGGYLITKYLLEQGHRAIAGVFKADDFQGEQRHKGYVAALQEAGLSYVTDRVIWFHTEDRKRKPALMAIKMMNQESRPDAFVCYNDQIAKVIYDTLQQQGICIPEDLSITGYDDSYIAKNAPVPFTTVQHPQEMLGKMAAALLLEKIHGVSDEESKVQRLIEPKIVIRKSCQKRTSNKEEDF